MENTADEQPDKGWDVVVVAVVVEVVVLVDVCVVVEVVVADQGSEWAQVLGTIKVL